ncbi:proline--tRNA ligase, partial [Peribacillus frigoritolerans]
GEDTIAYSDTSDYAANIEMAPVNVKYEKSSEEQIALEKIHTPGQKSIEEVAAFLNTDAAKLIKSLLFKVDEKYVLVLVRGDHEVNDIKLKNFYNASIVDLVDPNETKEVLGCAIGSLGPINVTSDVEVIADLAVEAMVNGVCGANEEDHHYVNVNPARDFNVANYIDLRFIQEGDLSPDGNGKIKFAKGIEVGHVFKLGTKYSEAMNATFLDENGRSQPMIMGCYGIGVSRTLAAVAEQFNDEKGLVWPKNLAPYQVHLIPINMKDEAQAALAEDLYKDLKAQGMEVLMDDRQERAGVKFADSDLIGLPVRVTVGKKASDGIVEVKIRKTGEVLELERAELTQKLHEILG